MPIGNYPDFASCLKDQKRKGHSKISAQKICGFLEQKAKHAMMEKEKQKKRIKDAY